MARTYRTGQVTRSRTGAMAAVISLISMLTSACWSAVIRAARPSRRASGSSQPHPAEQLPDPLTTLLAGQAVRHSAVHGHHPQDAVRIPLGPVHRERRTVGPAHEQRPVHPGRLEDGIEVSEARLEGVVRRPLRFAAGPLVVGDVSPVGAEFGDHGPPGPLVGIGAVEVDDGTARAADVGNGQSRVVDRDHAGPGGVPQPPRRDRRRPVARRRASPGAAVFANFHLAPLYYPPSILYIRNTAA